MQGAEGAGAADSCTKGDFRGVRAGLVRRAGLSGSIKRGYAEYRDSRGRYVRMYGLDFLERGFYPQGSRQTDMPTCLFVLPLCGNQ